MPEGPPPAPKPEQEGEFDLEKWIQTELYRQYDEQVEMLNEVGILDHFPAEDGEEDFVGILGIDGEKYALPSKEAIAQEIRDHQEKYQTKIEQGFVVLNLVPFAKPLEQFQEAMRKLILEHHHKGKLLSVIGEPLELDKVNPFIAWEDFEGADVRGELIYYPEKFDQQVHQGKTKQEIIELTKKTPFAGWQVQLLEDLPFIPERRRGAIGSTSIMSGWSPSSYLDMLRTSSDYHVEQGMTSEDWMIYFLTYLKRTNQAIGSEEVRGAGCWLLGAYDYSNNQVPNAHWSQEHKQAILGMNNPGAHFKEDNIRPVVRIGELEINS